MYKVQSRQHRSRQHASSMLGYLVGRMTLHIEMALCVTADTVPGRDSLQDDHELSESEISDHKNHTGPIKKALPTKYSSDRSKQRTVSPYSSFSPTVSRASGLGTITA